MSETKRDIQAKKAWLSQHMADTKRLHSEGYGAGMPDTGFLGNYREALQREWDRLNALEQAGEAEGWRE